MKSIKNISLQTICLMVKAGGGKIEKQMVLPGGIIKIPDSGTTKQIEAYAIKRMIKIF